MSRGLVLPYISDIGTYRPKGCGFWAVLVRKQVYTLPILVWNRAWFLRELLGVYERNEKERKKERKKEREIREFEMDFKKSLFVAFLI